MVLHGQFKKKMIADQEGWGLAMNKLVGEIFNLPLGAQSAL
jgi:hypothetical protein